MAEGEFLKNDWKSKGKEGERKILGIKRNKGKPGGEERRGKGEKRDNNNTND